MAGTPPDPPIVHCSQFWEMGVAGKAPIVHCGQLWEMGVAGKAPIVHCSQLWEMALAGKAPIVNCHLSEMVRIRNKSLAATNKAASSSTSLNTRKLDEETENLPYEHVPMELKKAIVQARTEKKLTQTQLARMINEKPRIIQDYESGKAILNQQIITKLERALGVKLRGKKENNA